MTHPPNTLLPTIMGILNITRDSFSDGGLWYDTDKAVAQGIAMHKAGAGIIDIGAESTRPGAKAIDEHTEWQRIEPVLKELKRQLPHCRFSIDTQKAIVAENAILAGADIINDISAMEYDPQMAAVVAKYPKTEVILMHMQGRPETMQDNPQYTDVVAEVKDYLIKRLQYAESRGIGTQRIYLDPGIGFGKSLEHNLAILANLQQYHGYNLVLGASRKSFIHRIVPSLPDERIGGSLAAICFALDAGAKIIRVHDVPEHRQFIHVYQEIRAHRRKEQ